MTKPTFNQELEAIGFNQEEQQNVLNAGFNCVEDVLLLLEPGNEEDLSKCNLRQSTKLRLKKFKALAEAMSAGIALDGDNIVEEEMLPIGEEVWRNLTQLSTKLRAARKRFERVLILTNVPTLCINAGLVISDDIVVAMLPYLNRDYPLVGARISTVLANNGNAFMWIGAAAAFTVQTVYHTYHYFQGDITWQQLVKFTTINAIAGSAAVGGGMFGAAIATYFFPGLGTLIGGMVGSILGGVAAGTSAQLLGSYLGNKIVDDEEHFKRAERLKQYRNALEVFGMKDLEVSKEAVEKKKRILYKMYHPDKYYTPESKQQAYEKFLTVCGAYYTIMAEKKYIDIASDVPATSNLLQ